MCIQLNLDRPLLKHLWIGSSKQEILYEGIDRLCFECGVVGHRAEGCASGAQGVPDRNQQRDSGTGGDDTAQQPTGEAGIGPAEVSGRARGTEGSDSLGRRKDNDRIGKEKACTGFGPCLLVQKRKGKDRQRGFEAEDAGRSRESSGGRGGFQQGKAESERVGKKGEGFAFNAGWQRDGEKEKACAGFGRGTGTDTTGRPAEGPTGRARINTGQKGKAWEVRRRAQAQSGLNRSPRFQLSGPDIEPGEFSATREQERSERGWEFRAHRAGERKKEEPDKEAQQRVDDRDTGQEEGRREAGYPTNLEMSGGEASPEDTGEGEGRENSVSHADACNRAGANGENMRRKEGAGAVEEGEISDSLHEERAGSSQHERAVRSGGEISD